MPSVVILTLRDPARHGCGGGEACACGDGPARVPVLACSDTLRAGGAAVEAVTAGSDADIDEVVKRVIADEARLVAAAATDAEVRAVVRRMVRALAPPPSRRPADLPANRTVHDLPPLAVLPLTPAVPPLCGALRLPSTPADVAMATLGGRARRWDLLRGEGGSVSLHGILLGGFDGGTPAPLRARIEVDDTMLSDGSQPLLATAIWIAGSSEVDGLPLVTSAVADDGLVEVAVAEPVLRRRLLRTADARIEVRRARGRAMSVTPHEDSLRSVDDGVVGPITRKRSWWTEPGAWATYVL